MSRARQDTRCRHYNGPRDSYTCGAGVDMLSFNSGDSHGFVLKLPCWGADGFDHRSTPCSCEKYSPLTADENAAHEAELHDFMCVMVTVREGIEIRNKEHGEWQGLLPCPKCQTGTLRWRMARVNRHVHAHCSTEGCLSWME